MPFAGPLEHNVISPHYWSTLSTILSNDGMYCNLLPKHQMQSPILRLTLQKHLGLVNQDTYMNRANSQAKMLEMLKS